MEPGISPASGMQADAAIDLQAASSLVALSGVWIKIVEIGAE